MMQGTPGAVKAVVNDQDSFGGSKALLDELYLPAVPDDGPVH